MAICAVSQEGRTALIKACNNGRRLEAVRALLAAGADAKAKDQVGGEGSSEDKRRRVGGCEGTEYLG